VLGTLASYLTPLAVSLLKEGRRRSTSPALGDIVSLLGSLCSLE
jgi:hypothetical protein